MKSIVTRAYNRKERKIFNLTPIIILSHRSSRVEPPDLAGMLRSTDDIIESLVCPPPPSDPAMMSEEMISGLIVPAPNWRKCT